MRWSACLLVASLAACGGVGAESIVTTIAEAPTSAVAANCSRDDFRARSAMFQSAEAGEIPADVPPQLGLAIESVPSTLLGGVLYLGCSTEEVDELTFERMAWTNGIGLLLVAWQELPGDGDLIGVPFGGSTRQAGVVEVSAIDETAIERTRIVHLFDGVRVVTVATFSLTTLSIEKVEEIAWAVYDAIPVDVSSRAGVGASRSLDPLVAALASDEVSVGDPEGLLEISPFTATLGMANATYQLTVAGNVVKVFDFGAVGAADRAATAVSRDGYTIAHTPYEVVATPRYWQWDRLIIQYMGDNSLLIERLNEVVGPAFAGSNGA